MVECPGQGEMIPDMTRLLDQGHKGIRLFYALPPCDDPMATNERPTMVFQGFGCCLSEGLAAESTFDNGDLREVIGAFGVGRNQAVVLLSEGFYECRGSQRKP